MAPISVTEVTFSSVKKPVHFAAQAHLDAAVPQPAKAYLDFAVVNLLEFSGEIHAILVCRNMIVVHKGIQSEDIRRARKMLGWKHRQLAAKAGVSLSVKYMDFSPGQVRGMYDNVFRVVDCFERHGGDPRPVMIPGCAR